MSGDRRWWLQATTAAGLLAAAGRVRGSGREEQPMDLAVWPEPLPAGGLIGVVAPASSVSSGMLQRGVASLRGRGYRVRLGQHVNARWHYLAGDDAGRIADLEAMFSDPAVDAIWCARGGYGTPRLLGQFDWSVARRHPKPLVGYSDITALQMGLFARAHLISFSGPMVASGHGFGAASGCHPATSRDCFRWLGAAEFPRFLGDPEGRPLRVVREGRAAGRLLGGNLSLVAALCGTLYLPDLRGAILVIEDIGEEPYRIDRMLSQLKLTGVFEEIGGLLVGDLAQCFPPRVQAPGPPPLELVMQFVGDRDIPVIEQFPYGHIGRKATLPLGAWAELDTAQPTIRIHPNRPAAGRR